MSAAWESHKVVNSKKGQMVELKEYPELQKEVGAWNSWGRGVTTVKA